MTVDTSWHVDQTSGICAVSATAEDAAVREHFSIAGVCEELELGSSDVYTLIAESEWEGKGQGIQDSAVKLGTAIKRYALKVQWNSMR